MGLPPAPVSRLPYNVDGESPFRFMSPWQSIKRRKITSTKKSRKNKVNLL